MKNFLMLPLLLPHFLTTNELYGVILAQVENLDYL